MRRVNLLAAGLFALGLTVLPREVSAVPLEVAAHIDDFDHPQLTVGQLYIWVSSCTITDASQGWYQESCAGKGLELVAGTSSAGHAQVFIQSATPGGHIFDVMGSIPGETYDLSVALDVATIDGYAKIKSNAITIQGTASPADAQYATVGETIEFGDGSNFGAPTASIGNPQTVSFARQAYLFAHKDIGDQLGHISSHVTIDRVGQSFELVPEPASVGLLLFGLAALGVARRRARV